MSKSYVLQALRLLGLEEMLRLSQAIKVKQAPLKKAAGEELIVWSDPPEKDEKKPDEPKEGKILAFKKHQNEDSELSEPLPDPALENGTPDEKGASLLQSSEFILWQRELLKETSAPSKKEAVKGYRKSTEMYVVKSEDPEGKEKIRFASTNGVLVNKKQA